jgi:hypothetical protein
MNLIVLFEDDFIGDTRHVRLRGRRHAHVLGVHRAQVGETRRVGLLDGRLGTARITLLSGDALEMDVTLNRPPPPPLPLTLLLALPRPKSLKRVLQAVTAMGVKRIVLMNAWRVEKSFWESPVLQPETLREQMVLGLEQARLAGASTRRAALPAWSSGSGHAGGRPRGRLHPVRGRAAAGAGLYGGVARRAHLARRARRAGAAGESGLKQTTDGETTDASPCSCWRRIRHLSSVV